MSSGAIHGYPEATFLAAAAITQYDAVYLSAANTVTANAGTTETNIGIAQEAQATASAPVTIRVAGFSLAVAAAGGWTLGDKLTGSTGGTLLTTTTAANVVGAIAMDTISAAETGEVFIVSPGIRYDSF